MLNEIKDAVVALQNQFKLTDFEALQIAVKIQENRLYRDAHVLDSNVPSALEAIAAQLGFSKGPFNTTMVDALSGIGQSIAGRE